MLRFSNINDESMDEGVQLLLLSELADTLTMASGHVNIAPLVGPLVRALSSMNPEINLAAVRGLNAALDIDARTTRDLIVRNKALPHLCGKLSAIMDMDVAEQCLKCLHEVVGVGRSGCRAAWEAGAFRACLQFLEFFSQETQHLALSTAARLGKYSGQREDVGQISEMLPLLCSQLNHSSDTKVRQTSSQCIEQIVESFDPGRVPDASYQEEEEEEEEEDEEEDGEVGTRDEWVVRSAVSKRRETAALPSSESKCNTPSWKKSFLKELARCGVVDHWVQLLRKGAGTAQRARILRSLTILLGASPQVAVTLYGQGATEALKSRLMHRMTGTGDREIGDAGPPETSSEQAHSGVELVEALRLARALLPAVPPAQSATPLPSQPSANQQAKRVKEQAASAPAAETVATEAAKEPCSTKKAKKTRGKKKGDSIVKPSELTEFKSDKTLAPEDQFATPAKMSFLDFKPPAQGASSDWACSACTYLNTGSAPLSCEICGTPNPKFSHILESSPILPFAMHEIGGFSSRLTKSARLAFQFDEKPAALESKQPLIGKQGIEKELSPPENHLSLEDIYKENPGFYELFAQDLLYPMLQNVAVSSLSETGDFVDGLILSVLKSIIVHAADALKTMDISNEICLALSRLLHKWEARALRFLPYMPARTGVSTIGRENLGFAVLRASISVATVLLRRLPDMYSALFSRQGVVQQIVGIGFTIKEKEELANQRKKLRQTNERLERILSIDPQEPVVRDEKKASTAPAEGMADLREAVEKFTDEMEAKTSKPDTGAPSKGKRKLSSSFKESEMLKSLKTLASSFRKYTCNDPDESEMKGTFQAFANYLLSPEGVTGYELRESNVIPVLLELLWTESFQLQSNAGPRFAMRSFVGTFMKDDGPPALRSLLLAVQHCLSACALDLPVVRHGGSILSQQMKAVVRPFSIKIEAKPCMSQNLTFTGIPEKIMIEPLVTFGELKNFLEKRIKAEPLKKEGISPALEKPQPLRSDFTLPQKEKAPKRFSFLQRTKDCEIPPAASKEITKNTKTKSMPHPVKKSASKNAAAALEPTSKIPTAKLEKINISATSAPSAAKPTKKTVETMASLPSKGKASASAPAKETALSSQALLLDEMLMNRGEKLSRMVRFNAAQMDHDLRLHSDFTEHTHLPFSSTLTALGVTRDPMESLDLLEKMEDEQNKNSFARYQAQKKQFEMLGMSQSTERPGKAVFEKGAQVYSLFAGIWYKGKVLRKNRDNTCTVLYEDGDTRENVPPEDMRHAPPIGANTYGNLSAHGRASMGAALWASAGSAKSKGQESAKTWSSNLAHFFGLGVPLLKPSVPGLVDEEEQPNEVSIQIRRQRRRQVPEEPASLSNPTDGPKTRGAMARTGANQNTRSKRSAATSAATSSLDEKIPALRSKRKIGETCSSQRSQSKISEDEVLLGQKKAEKATPFTPGLHPLSLRSGTAPPIPHPLEFKYRLKTENSKGVWVKESNKVIAQIVQECQFKASRSSRCNELKSEETWIQPEHWRCHYILEVSFGTGPADDSLSEISPLENRKRDNVFVDDLKDSQALLKPSPVSFHVLPIGVGEIGAVLFKAQNAISNCNLAADRLGVPYLLLLELVKVLLTEAVQENQILIDLEDRPSLQANELTELIRLCTAEALSSELRNQICEPLASCGNFLPAWTHRLITSNKAGSSHARVLSASCRLGALGYFRLCGLGRAQTISELQVRARQAQADPAPHPLLSQRPSGPSHDGASLLEVLQGQLGTLKRVKVIAPRANCLESAKALFAAIFEGVNKPEVAEILPADSDSDEDEPEERKLPPFRNSRLTCKGLEPLLLFEFEGETGHGKGPTLEFYTHVCSELQRKGGILWREDPSHQGVYISSQGGLFPRVMKANATAEEKAEIEKQFIFVGRFLGKALQDNRPLDLPLALPLCKVITGSKLCAKDLIHIDRQIALSLDQLYHIFRNYQQKTGKREKTAIEKEVEAMYLRFTLPGDSAYELKPNGSQINVTASNLGDYCHLVADHLLFKGVSLQISALKQGISDVIDIKSLGCFTPQELQEALCGLQRDDEWKQEEIIKHIKCGHGYLETSSQVKNMVTVMSEFTPEERRHFLSFVTGTPRLPPGGFSALNPKMTLVKKSVPDGQDPDNMLPSCSTCQVYIKLPPYTSISVMKQKIKMAILEGRNHFALD